MAPYRYGPPLSPHYAAELAGETIEPARLSPRRAPPATPLLVAEGVGGLLVPITPGYLVRDLARDLALPVVIAARTRPGHDQPHAAHRRGRARGRARGRGSRDDPLAGAPEPIEVSNRATVERLAGVPVSGLRRDPPAEAGAAATGRVALTDLATRWMATEESAAEKPDDTPELLLKLRERKARHKQRHILHRAAIVVLGLVIVLAGS